MYTPFKPQSHRIDRTAIPARLSVGVVVLVIVSLIALPVSAAGQTAATTGATEVTDSRELKSQPQITAPSSDGASSPMAPANTTTLETLPGDEEIPVNGSYTLRLAPDDPGNITVTLRIEVPKEMPRYGMIPRDNHTVISSDGLTETTLNAGDEDIDLWKVPDDRDSDTTVALTYTVSVNRTKGGDYSSVATTEYAIIEPVYEVGTLVGGSEGVTFDFNIEHKIDGPGFYHSRYVVLGPNEVYETSAGPNSFTLVVPNATDLVRPPEEILTILEDGSTEFEGAVNEPVTAFAVPDEFMGGVAMGDTIFVNAGRPHSNSIWVHEYVHTQQWPTGYARGPDHTVEWFTEASANYYQELLAWKAGRMDAQEFQWKVTSEFNAVLQDADHESTEDKNYLKGRHVLAALDYRIRAHTDGNATLTTVFNHLNSIEDRQFSYTDLRGKVVELTNESTGQWLDRHVTTKAMPSIPNASRLGEVYDINSPPYVAPATSSEGATVRLWALTSGDVDGDALSFEWTQVAGPSVTFDDASTQNPTVRLPNSYDGSKLTFEVTVTDEHGLSDTETVSISPEVRTVSGQVTRQDGGPVANATVLVIDAHWGAHLENESIEKLRSLAEPPVASNANVVTTNDTGHYQTRIGSTNTTVIAFTDSAVSDVHELSVPAGEHRHVDPVLRGATLIDQVDTNGDGAINNSELSAAINKWARGKFTDAELSRLIREWAQSA